MMKSVESNEPADYATDDGVWVTATGQCIPYEKIKDDHLGNILRFLLRKAEAKRLLQVATYLSSSLPRDDKVYDEFMAEFDDHLNETFRDYVSPKFVGLEKEALRRGLAWAPFEEEAAWARGTYLQHLHALMHGGQAPSLNKDKAGVSIEDAAKNLYKLLRGIPWLDAVGIESSGSFICVYVKNPRNHMLSASKRVPRVYQEHMIVLTGALLDEKEQVITLAELAKIAPTPPPAAQQDPPTGADIKSWSVSWETEAAPTAHVRNSFKDMSAAVAYAADVYARNPTSKRFRLTPSRMEPSMPVESPHYHRITANPSGGLVPEWRYQWWWNQSSMFHDGNVHLSTVAFDTRAAAEAHVNACSAFDNSYGYTRQYVVVAVLPEQPSVPAAASPVLEIEKPAPKPTVCRSWKIQRHTSDGAYVDCGPRRYTHAATAAVIAIDFKRLLPKNTYRLAPSNELANNGTLPNNPLLAAPPSWVVRWWYKDNSPERGHTPVQTGCYASYTNADAAMIRLTEQHAALCKETNSEPFCAYDVFPSTLQPIG